MLRIRSSINFEITDGREHIFQSGRHLTQVTTLDEYFSGRIKLAPNAYDVPVSMYNVTNGKYVYVFSDEGDLRVKLVMNGFTRDDSPSIVVPKGTPLMLATQDLIAIYLINPSATLAIDAIVAGAGDETTPSGPPAPPPTPTDITNAQLQKVTNSFIHTLSSGEITAKQITLPMTPVDPALMLVDVEGGSMMAVGTDFTLTGVTFSWAGKPLDGVLQAGDRIRFYYLASLI